MTSSGCRPFPIAVAGIDRSPPYQVQRQSPLNQPPIGNLQLVWANTNSPMFISNTSTK
jgi:hypothetical protein